LSESGGEVEEIKDGPLVERGCVRTSTSSKMEKVWGGKKKKVFV